MRHKIQMKPVRKQVSLKYHEYLCPKCGKRLNYDKQCKQCGTAIKWGE